MSEIVFTKKYHPDGSFDKYKVRIVFRGDKWYGLYNNKTYASTVMSETGGPCCLSLQLRT